MLVETISNFASEMSWDQLSDPIKRLARCQLIGWLGSVRSGQLIDEAEGICSVAGQFGAGEVPVHGVPEQRFSVLGAAYASTVFSCANDYDDYLFLAHTGHSACGVAAAVGYQNGAKTRDVLAAMVAANEAMGRLGASCLIGPQNGQLWTFVHLAGAVIAGARLDEQPADVLSSALSLAFFQPPHALWPGFGAASSKLLSAATPTLLGLLALEHAKSGMTGAEDALEGPQGFFDQFSYLPLKSVFDDLGTHFVTRSLSIKPVPGCAYVTAPIQVALKCAQDFGLATGRPLRPEDIQRVRVSAGPMTIGMQRLLGHRAERPPYISEGVNFSVPLSVAVALLHGVMTPKELTHTALAEHREQLGAIANRVELKAHGALAADLVKQVGLRTGLVRHLRRHPTKKAIRALGRALRTAGANRGSGSNRLRIELLRKLRFDSDSLGEYGEERYAFAYPFGAEMCLETTAGEFHHAVRIPAGASGRSIDSIAELAENKFVRECNEPADASSWAKQVISGTLDDDPFPELWRRMPS